jgi:hypothetical protein
MYCNVGVVVLKLEVVGLAPGYSPTIVNYNISVIKLTCNISRCLKNIFVVYFPQIRNSSECQVTNTE